ncbi:MAG: hypothetical protein AABX07_03075 [Nanoarchaeota archaeon]
MPKNNKEASKEDTKESKSKSINKEESERSVRLIFYLVLGIAVGTLLVYFIFSVFFSNITLFSNTFKYKSLPFTKENNMGLTIYHYTYTYQIDNGQTIKNNILLRKDPRKNNVPVEGKITFEGERKIYSTINTTGLLNCSSILRDSSYIPYFLVNNLFVVVIGSVDEAEAQASNVTHITCEKYPNDKVIFIQEGNETKITRKGNCFILSVANCELLEASEKFEVQAIIDAKEQAGLLK